MRKLVFVLLAVVCLGVSPGCRTRYVVRTEEKVKTEYKTKLLRDSVYFSDTVRVLQKGDTVFVEKVKYTQKYKTLIDTVLRVDTVVQVKRERALHPHRLLDVAHFKCGAYSVPPYSFLFWRGGLCRE